MVVPATDHALKQLLQNGLFIFGYRLRRTEKHPHPRIKSFGGRVCVWTDQGHGRAHTQGYL